MEERIRKIISNEYNLNVEELNILQGGFRLDETYFLVTSDQHKYVVKYIQYSHSFEHLQSILKFENLLHDLYKYPCPQIILSNKEEFVISDNNRCLFIQTFIQGIEPTREILDKDDIYLNQMGRLLAQWRMAYREYSIDIQREEDQQLTEKWWQKQQMNNVDPFLLSNFVQCKEYLIHLNEKWEDIVDFVDACQAPFISDLATSILHLLVDKQNGIHRAKAFIQGYQQIIQLTSEEINVIDVFVRLKLTLSIIEDLRHSNDTNDPFIQSCFQLLHTLNNDSTLVKNLLE